MSSVEERGLNDEGKGALWVVEAVSVTVFTIEFGLRFYSIGQDPKYSGARGRLQFLTTFFTLVDLAAIVPFFIDLALPGDLKGTAFIRALRLIRLLKAEKYHVVR